MSVTHKQGKVPTHSPSTERVSGKPRAISAPIIRTLGCLAVEATSFSRDALSRRGGRVNAPKAKKNVAVQVIGKFAKALRVILRSSKAAAPKAMPIRATAGYAW